MSLTSRSVSAESYHEKVRWDVLPSVPKTGGVLVDLGGGVGATARELKSLGYAQRVGVVDAIPLASQLGDLDFRYSGNLADAAFVKDVYRREGPFDAVLLLDILEHLVDPWGFMRDLHGYVKEGGVVVASIPNVRNFRALFPLLFLNRWTLQDDGILDRTHLRFFVRSTAIQLMTSTGLRLESIRACPTDHPLIRLFRRLTLGLFNSFTDRNYVLVVRRVD